jgi:uncharacterized membrane protein
MVVEDLVEDEVEDDDTIVIVEMVLYKNQIVNEKSNNVMAIIPLLIYVLVHVNLLQNDIILQVLQTQQNQNLIYLVVVRLILHQLIRVNIYHSGGNLSLITLYALFQAVVML